MSKINLFKHALPLFLGEISIFNFDQLFTLKVYLQQKGNGKKGPAPAGTDPRVRLADILDLSDIEKVDYLHMFKDNLTVIVSFLNDKERF